MKSFLSAASLVFLLSVHNLGYANQCEIQVSEGKTSFSFSGIKDDRESPATLRQVMTQNSSYTKGSIYTDQYDGLSVSTSIVESRYKLTKSMGISQLS